MKLHTALVTFRHGARSTDPIFINSMFSCLQFPGTPLHELPDGHGTVQWEAELTSEPKKAATLKVQDPSGGPRPFSQHDVDQVDSFGLKSQHFMISDH